MSHAISSPPSFTTIKSLLILAHLPGFPQIPPPEGGKALPSVSAVVQIAKGMARGLGMDRAVPSMVGMEDDCLMGLDGYVVWRCLLQQEFWYVRAHTRGSGVRLIFGVGSPSSCPPTSRRTRSRTFLPR